MAADALYRQVINNHAIDDVAWSVVYHQEWF